MAFDATIWIVRGQTGEYDDTESWPVRAVGTEEEAKSLASSANEAARLNHYHLDANGSLAHRKAVYAHQENPFDEQLTHRLAWPGVNYYYESTPMTKEE